jgi:hypothetical protein
MMLQAGNFCNRPLSAEITTIMVPPEGGKIPLCEKILCEQRQRVTEDNRPDDDDYYGAIMRS